jgi:hypothetical protein
MRKLLLTCLAICLGLFKPALAQQGQDFKTILKENGLEFNQPVGFVKTGVIKNPDLYYDYAMKLKKDSFEVRYSVFPLHPLLADYEESLKDPDRTALDPNKYYRSMFMANILNVAQVGLEDMPSTGDFPSEAVKEEFGADYGATSFFVPNSEFGTNYRLCLMVVIHKKDLADVYICFLGNNEESFEENMMRAFHALKFKP